MSIHYQQPKNLTQLKAWWSAPSGYRQVLAIAGPLVLSTSSMTIQQFVDRMFLAWYSPDALAASLPAGILVFTAICFFIGTASFVNTFVAQYVGSGQPERAASATWQAIYFSIAAGILVLSLVPWSARIFAIAGHEPALQKLEADYFAICISGGVFAITTSAISSFFTGLGRTHIVMWANVGATLLNIVLDYALIFGNYGFPEMGIRGAAYATVAASIFTTVVFFAVFFSQSYRREFHTTQSFRPDLELFWRLMRYGVPNGVHFFLDLSAFTLFIFLVGRLGALELAASSLAFQVNMVAFLPMIGFSIATATLVGQRLGENRPLLAIRSVWASLHLTTLYMSTIALAYVLFPNVFLVPFGVKADPAEFEPVRQIAVILLRFIALYSLFDAMNLIFSSALKGAGDTLFVMFMSTSLGFTIMVIPTWFVCQPGGSGLYAAWFFLTLFVVLMALCFLLRFLKGPWREMRVIQMPVISSSDDLEPGLAAAEV